MRRGFGGRRAAPAWLVSLAATLSGGCESGAAEGTVDVSCPSEAVAGFPIPVRFVVHGPAEVASAGLVSRTNPFEFELRSANATYVFPARRYREVRPPRKPYLEFRPEVLRIPLQATHVRKGESRELVVDLSRLERKTDRQVAGEAGMIPGEYVFAFLDPRHLFQPAGRRIRLVEPNAEEKKLLRNLSPTGGRDDIWRAFVERHGRAMAGLDTKLFSEAGRRQLGYQMLLAGLVNSAADIGELVVPDDLSGFLPGYRNEVLLLRYEIELAAGRAAAAEETRAAILAERPGSEALLDYVRQHGGLIARHRKAAARPGRRRRPDDAARHSVSTERDNP